MDSTSTADMASRAPDLSMVVVGAIVSLQGRISGGYGGGLGAELNSAGHAEWLQVMQHQQAPHAYGACSAATGEIIS
jgi:hypothetical protein